MIQDDSTRCEALVETSSFALPPTASGRMDGWRGRLPVARRRRCKDTQDGLRKAAAQALNGLHLPVGREWRGTWAFLRGPFRAYRDEKVARGDGLGRTVAMQTASKGRIG